MGDLDTIQTGSECSFIKKNHLSPHCPLTIIGSTFFLPLRVYLPVSSNMASWEIHELNGHLHKWENYRNTWWLFYCHVELITRRIAIAPFTAPSQALDCISQLCNLKPSHGRFYLPPKRLESSHIQHNWASLTRSCSTGHAWNSDLPTSFPSNQQWDPRYFHWRVTLMVYQDFHGNYSKVPKSMDK